MYVHVYVYLIYILYMYIQFTVYVHMLYVLDTLFLIIYCMLYITK